jgi:alpha-2-macroglobulin
MKSSALLSMALLALVQLSSAAPRLVVSTPSLAPESRIDLVLDLAAVAPESVGSTVPNDWFTVQPPLPGKLRWKAPNIAEFLPDQSPAMSATYVFTMRPGRTHLDGSAVPQGNFARLESETFRPLGWNAVGNRYAADYSPANGSWTVYFNDAIDPAIVAPSFHFHADGGQTVEATVLPVTWETMGYYGRSSKTWEARWKPADESVAPAPSDIVPHAVIVSPAAVLPTGKNWKLVLQSGLPNKSASARLAKALHYPIGDITPFHATDIQADTNINGPRTITLHFNSPLPEKLPDNLLTNVVHIAPRPDNLRASPDGRTLRITGDLDAADLYHVSIRPPFTSRVGHPLQKTLAKDIQFQHAEAGLSLPSDHQAQFSEGSRTYGIHTVNLSHVTLRVKQLGGSQLVRTFQGYRNYTGTGHNGENVSPTSPLPWPMVAGPLVAERAFDLSAQGIDTSKEIEFRWDDILPKHRTGIFFVDVSGTAHPKLGKYSQGRNAQAIVQLTDIGLAWKLTPRETLVQAFSCETGKPLAGVSPSASIGEDAALLHSATTDAHGLATLPSSNQARHLLARSARIPTSPPSIPRCPPSASGTSPSATRGTNPPRFPARPSSSPTARSTAPAKPSASKASSATSAATPRTSPATPRAASCSIPPKRKSCTRGHHHLPNGSFDFTHNSPRKPSATTRSASSTPRNSPP